MEKDTPTPTALPTRLTARETSSDSDITLIGRNSSLVPETQRPRLEGQQGDPEKKLEPPIDFEKRDLGRGNRDTDDHDIQKPPTLHPYDFDTQHTPRDFEKIDFISTPENAVTQPQTPHIHDPNRLTPYTTVSPSKYHTPRPSHLNPTTPQRPWLARQRPELTSNPTASASTRTLPQLKRKETRMMQKEAHPWEHLGITLGLPAIVLFDIVIPIIIYYSWYNAQPRVCDPTCHRRQFDKDIMGYAVICFGFGELWILLARVWRLYFRHDECAPLLSRSKWELDATCWVYLVAMVMALIPFVVGSSLVIPELYLYGPSFLMGFLGLLMVGTLVPFKLPIGINSQPRGTTIRPFIYYAAEDFIAVDGLQDREFRERYNQRYERNKAFRRMFLWLTLWWLAGVMTFIGCVSAVIWNCQFHIAFGLSLGVLFSYIAIWAGCSAAYVKWEIRRQHRLFEKGLVDA